MASKAFDLSLVNNSFACAFCLLVLALIVGCSSSAIAPAAPSLSSSDLSIVTIEIVDGQGRPFPLTVEIPTTREAMSRGLMGRESLPEDHGMLFLFGSARSGFWMKDTLIPLSVAFIASDGKIQHIEDMQPMTLNVHNTDKPYIYGLEVNQGWFDRYGIRVGDVVRFPWPYDAPPKSPWGQ